MKSEEKQKLLAYLLDVEDETTDEEPAHLSGDDLDYEIEERLKVLRERNKDLVREEIETHKAKGEPLDRKKLLKKLKIKDPNDEFIQDLIGEYLTTKV